MKLVAVFDGKSVYGQDLTECVNQIGFRFKWDFPKSSKPSSCTSSLRTTSEREGKLICGPGNGTFIYSKHHR